MNTLIIPVRDLDPAKRLHGRLLDQEPYMDETYYVGFRIGGQEVGLDPHGHSKGTTGPMVYMQVDDIDVVVKQLLAVGAELEQEIADGRGARIASIKDAEGNVIGLRQSPPAG